MGRFKTTADLRATTVPEAAPEATPTVTEVINSSTPLDSSHLNKYLNITGSGVTLTLPDASLYEGKTFHIHADDAYGTDTVFLSPVLAQTVWDKGSYSVPVGTYVQIRSNGSNWDVLNNVGGDNLNADIVADVYQNDYLAIDPLVGGARDSKYTVGDLQRAFNTTYGRATRSAAFNALLTFFHWCDVATPYTATLPDAAGESRGRIAFANAFDSAAVMTIAAGVGTVDGVSEVYLFPGEFVEFESDDTNWRTVNYAKENALGMHMTIDVSGAVTATLDAHHRCASGGSYTIDLITAVGNAGRRMSFHGIGLGALITIDPNGGELIGSSSLVGFDDTFFMQIVSDGTNWLIESAWMPFFNVGSGQGKVFKEMNGPRPMIKSILQGTNTRINNLTNEIEIHNLTPYRFFADQLDSPVTANWAVNNLAPATPDPANSALIIRRFDDATEEGVGALIDIPVGAVNITFALRGRAIAAPGGAVNAIFKLYRRTIPDNAAVGAWSAAQTLTAIALPTNTNFQYDTETFTLAALGLTAGTMAQLELTRDGANGSDTLVGDYGLLELRVSFS